MAADPYRYFRLEARELLDQFGDGVLALERGDNPAVPRLLRLAHTLKGAARVVKLPRIAERAHAIEEALERYRDGAGAVPRECVGTVLDHLGDIARQVAALDEPEAAAPGAEPAIRTLRTELAEIDALCDGIGEVQGRLNRLCGAAEASGDPRLSAAIDGLGRELRQLRDAAERLRLVPAAALFAPLERTARDAARQLGKEIAFTGSGGDIRLDAAVLGAVQAALVQIVRNAVAHGIEPPALRRAAGKSAAGQIAVSVSRRGPDIVFSCSDDGGGVDLEAVRRAAAGRGLGAAAATASAEELIALLLRGGISTAARVGEIAGRGIGLDVVRDAIDGIGGTVAVRTQRGAGTAVSLVVPLSRAALDALVVEADGTVAAIPLDAVERAVRIADEAPARVGALDTDSGPVPYARLGRLFDGCRAARSGARPAVILAAGDDRIALGIDRLHGCATVVVQPLPPALPASPLVAGASLDAEGRPLLVLDPSGLAAAARRADAAEPAAATETPRPPVLVIDDSLTTRMLEQGILESAGYQVDVAASGEEGLRLARGKRYGLFLVDVEMPGMDGYEFVARTRADPQLRDIPAILVTSRSAPEDVARGEAAGAAGYIVKSAFDQARLLAMIRPLTG